MLFATTARWRGCFIRTNLRETWWQAVNVVREHGCQFGKSTGRVHGRSFWGREHSPSRRPAVFTGSVESGQAPTLRQVVYVHVPLSPSSINSLNCYRCKPGEVTNGSLWKRCGRPFITPAQADRRLTEISSSRRILCTLCICSCSNRRVTLLFTRRLSPVIRISALLLLWCLNDW